MGCYDTCGNFSVANLYSKIWMRPGPIFFVVMQFFGKIGQIKGWQFPLVLEPTSAKSWVCSITAEPGQNWESTEVKCLKKEGIEQKS